MTNDRNTDRLIRAITTGEPVPGNAAQARELARTPDKWDALQTGLDMLGLRKPPPGAVQAPEDVIDPRAIAEMDEQVRRTHGATVRKWGGA